MQSTTEIRFHDPFQAKAEVPVFYSQEAFTTIFKGYGIA